MASVLPGRAAAKTTLGCRVLDNGCLGVAVLSCQSGRGMPAFGGHMAVNPSLLVILRSNSIGEAEPDLGEKLMKSWLTMLLEADELPGVMICMNTGIFLTTEGSPVLDILSALAERGVEIRSCTTCLAYYNREDRLKVGVASNMRATVTAMLQAGKVLQP
jgi:selenium metabolism protein YedF